MRINPAKKEACLGKIHDIAEGLGISVSQLSRGLYSWADAVIIGHKRIYRQSLPVD